MGAVSDHDDDAGGNLRAGYVVEREQTLRKLASAKALGVDVEVKRHTTTLKAVEAELKALGVSVADAEAWRKEVDAAAAEADAHSRLHGTTPVDARAILDVQTAVTDEPEDALLEALEAEGPDE